MVFYRRNIVISDDTITSAAQLTLKQSLVPNFLEITQYYSLYGLRPLGGILRGVKSSFGGFCGSMFVVGSGLATLETAADPFLSICGPPRYSEIRLNLAQAIQATGSFVAPLLASRVFFARSVDTAEGLKNVQWVYLGVAGFVGLLIVLFFLAPMPEITDADMHTQEALISDVDPGPLKKQYNLFLAVGAQVAVANYFVNFCEEAGKTPAVSSDIFAAAQGLYAFNRFVAGLRGLGRHTKIGGALIVAAISGGAVFPPMTGAVATHLQKQKSTKPFHTAMLIPMGGFICAWIYPIYVNLLKRDLMDGHRTTDVGIGPPLAEKEFSMVGSHVAKNDGHVTAV
ncbi:putative Glucose/galactose transporter [Glarea lozoyensis 74030]|uniref:Putative Glucose/galactose transporter n=1 Tax=Glarea lozoyensis (strain ATCC 74030 / MF5533) TaxID=1104152 RepID=H0EP33_GLAL7|nr:putative Glucose/galactose transporter [Glarea lozoyensis 74030]